MNQNDYQENIQANLRKIKLATHVIAEAHANLLEPIFPEDKADLLLATEDLATTAFDLMEDVRASIWSENLTGPTTES
jgi:t-SNARE complex subunit (syntaxin)